MLARQPDPMTFEQFLEWEQRQEEKHEYVDGRPVLRAIRKGWVGPRAMTGGARRHAHIAARIVHLLMTRLGDGPCQPAGADVQVRTAANRGRYPDVVVDCGRIDERLVAEDPRVLFEVLSPSNRFPDQLDLLDDFKSVPSVQQIVFLEQSRPLVLSWTRAGDLWPRRELEGLTAVLELPSIGTELPLVDLYRGVTFDPPL